MELEIINDEPDRNYEIYYSGELFISGNDALITNKSVEEPLKIVAKNQKNGQEILLFDGAFYGYNGMFCDVFERSMIENRPLIRYPLDNVCKINLSIGRGIDYESEKEDYEVDTNDCVALIDGRQVPWEQVKSDGFDYLGIKVMNSNQDIVEIVSEELS